MLTKTVAWGLVLWGCIVSDAKQSQASGCGTKWAQEYEQVMDAYFAHARGNSPTALVLRVYPAFLPEYEILLDPENSPGKLVRYAAKEPIWENVHSLAKPHLTIEQYVTQAEEIPFSKGEFKISDELMESLLARGKAIDTSICEHLSMMVKDAQSFEIIKDEGRTRAQVTDAGLKVHSQNPALLSWGHDLLRAVGPPPNRN